MFGILGGYGVWFSFTCVLKTVVVKVEAKFGSARNTTRGTVLLLRAISNTLPNFTTKRHLPGDACAKVGRSN